MNGALDILLISIIILALCGSFYGTTQYLYKRARARNRWSITERQQYKFLRRGTWAISDAVWYVVEDRLREQLPRPFISRHYAEKYIEEMKKDLSIQ